MNFSAYFENRKFQILFLFVLFAILYLWRPFFLGYYADDWNYIFEYKFFLNGSDSPFAIDNLKYYMGQLGNRPLTAITYFIGYSINGFANPIGWHFYILILFSTSIITFRYCSKEFFKFIGYPLSGALSELPTALYMASPWMLATNTWISASMSLPAMTFFFLFSFYVFKSINNQRKYYLAGFLSLLISLLYYESFYLQWLIVISILLAFRKSKNISYSSIAKYILISIAAQGFAVLWNRFSPIFFENLVVKSTNPYILQTFAANIASLPYAFAMSFLYGSIILIPVLIYLFIKDRKLLYNNKNLKYTYLLLFVGIVLSIIIFSGAGYSLWGLGMRSRTMMAIGFYIVLIMSIVLILPIQHNIMGKKTVHIIALLFVIILSVSNFSNSLDWVKAWEIQKSMLNNLPNEQINKTDKNSIIMLSDDYIFKHNWISVFDAQWAVNAQLNYGYLAINGFKDSTKMLHENRRFTIGKNIVHPVNHKYYTNVLRADSLFQMYRDNNIKSSKGNFYTQEYAYSMSELNIMYNKYPYIKKITNDTIIQLNPIKNYDYWITYLYNKYFKKTI